MDKLLEYILAAVLAVVIGLSIGFTLADMREQSQKRIREILERNERRCKDWREWDDTWVWWE